MRWRFLLKEYGPEILHVASTANSIANAIGRFDMDLTCMVSERILKGLDVNDYIHFIHVNFTRALSSSLQDNAELGSSVLECFANVSEAVEDIAFITITEITHD